MAFVTSFIWSPSRDGLDVVFYLCFFIPFLLVLPWQKPQPTEYGGWLSLTALAYAGVAAIASLWGEPSDFGFFVWQWITLAFWLCGVSWLACYRELDLRRLYHAMILIGFLVGFTSVIYFYSNHSLSERLVGWSVARNPTVIAQIFGSIAIVAYVLSLQAKNLRASLLYFFATLLLIMPMVLSQSRGPALAFVAMAFVAILLVRPARIFVVVQCFATLLAVVLVMLFTDAASILSERGISMSMRDIIWRDVLILALDSPVFGVGSERMDHLQLPSGYFHHPHNAWLDIFYRTGALGLMLALVHLWVLVRSYKPIESSLPLYVWFGFGCICLFTDSRVLFWELNAKWFLYWIPAGLIGAVVAARAVTRTEA
jgi:O-antigen ligase